MSPTGGHLATLLAPGAVSVLFQPIFRVGSGGPHLHGAEGLTRGPEGTNLHAAAVLFEYVRRKGREPDMDRVCLTAILGAAGSLHALPEAALLSCNVHAATLERDTEFAPFLESLAGASGWPLGRLVLEIVEHAPAWGGPRFLHVLSQLRALGVRLALDDIGLGQSNFRMILDCQPDFLKIDAFLVQGCHADPRRQAILDALAQLADRLGSPLIAEGVEAAADLAALQRVGIDLVQGYLLSRPLTADGLEAASWNGKART